MVHLKIVKYFVHINLFFFVYSNFSQSMVTPFPMMSAVHLQNAIPSYPSG